MAVVVAGRQHLRDLTFLSLGATARAITDQMTKLVTGHWQSTTVAIRSYAPVGSWSEIQFTVHGHDRGCKTERSS